MPHDPYGDVRPHRLLESRLEPRHLTGRGCGHLGVQVPERGDQPPGDWGEEIPRAVISTNAKRST